MSQTALPVAAGLATGIGFIVLFAVLTSDFPILRVPSTGSSGQVSVVVIPEGYNMPSSGKTYEPQVITVMIGVNNTVRWVNQDVTSNWIEAGSYDDPDFALETMDIKLIPPGGSFEYTFEKAGEFGYYGKPHQQGTVIVLEQALSANTPADDYDCGRIFTGGPGIDQPTEWEYNLLYQWGRGIDGQRYEFYYEGEISDVAANTDRHSIEFDGRSAGTTLQLRLPRALIDSTHDGRDAPFTVLVNGQPSINATQGVVPSTGDRMVCIPLPHFGPVSQIEVIGTRIAQE